jgi:O-acetyl-ADP-ribose deacetylase (regulator of RNase III)
MGARIPFQMPTLTAISDDITTLRVDAIVNAANSSLAGGGGVDGAIHRSGGPEILRQCQEWVHVHGRLPTGEAMVTDGGRLPAPKVIHTVGPVWSNHEPAEADDLLARCYSNSLETARQHDCRSIAFPNISTGVYGYPKERAGRIAVEAVRTSLAAHDAIEQVIFCCFSEDNLRIYEDLLDS